MTRADFEELAVSFTKSHVRELHEWSTSSIKFKARLAALIEDVYFAAMHDAAKYAESCQRDECSPAGIATQLRAKTPTPPMDGDT